MTISTPPTPVLLQMLTTYAQLRRSWYIFLFQHPAIEMILPLNDFAFLDELWAEWSPGFTHTAELHTVNETLRHPENLNAIVAWFRGAVHPETDRPELATEQAALAQVPTQPWLYLHGDQDQCVGVEAATLVGGNSVVIRGAGYFPHLEQQDAFHAQLVNFLQPSQ
ncbi:hypothetical protein KDA_52270 [Dictyobacter alpinus]|uniref:AB hydrolase-1 domain-containing protein n=1 Tax=Dictyobacter alpinus TaxID=2014873 RepID=A0A402BED1_9CHLR|nr:hypothetical protein KDA_52270 [Dictyobacter alpinus]